MVFVLSPFVGHQYFPPGDRRAGNLNDRNRRCFWIGKRLNRCARGVVIDSCYDVVRVALVSSGIVHRCLMGSPRFQCDLGRFGALGYMRVCGRSVCK